MAQEEVAEALEDIEPEQDLLLLQTLRTQLLLVVAVLAHLQQTPMEVTLYLAPSHLRVADTEEGGRLAP
jgi:hypothetical protein